MSRGRVFIDRFDCGLTELPRAQQRDRHAVLRHIIATGGRFSCFEASDNPSIAKTVTEICHGVFVTADSSSPGPWTYLTLTDAGRATFPDVAKLEAGRRTLQGDNDG